MERAMREGCKKIEAAWWFIGITLGFLFRSMYILSWVILCAVVVATILTVIMGSHPRYIMGRLSQV